MPKCRYCNKEFKNQGGVNLHEKIHCPQRTEAAGTAESKSDGHVCKFRLLSPKVAAEKIAIQKNYEEICDGCKEVR